MNTKPIEDGLLSIAIALRNEANRDIGSDRLEAWIVEHKRNLQELLIKYREALSLRLNWGAEENHCCKTCFEFDFWRAKKSDQWRCINCDPPSERMIDHPEYLDQVCMLLDGESPERFPPTHRTTEGRVPITEEPKRITHLEGYARWLADLLERYAKHVSGAAEPEGKSPARGGIREPLKKFTKDQRIPFTKFSKRQIEKLIEERLPTSDMRTLAETAMDYIFWRNKRRETCGGRVFAMDYFESQDIEGSSQSISDGCKYLRERLGIDLEN